MSKTLYIAVNNNIYTGYALGDTIVAIRMAWAFLNDVRPDNIILSLNRHGGDLNFLWSKFCRENCVDVVFDDFHDVDSKFKAYNERIVERSVHGKRFDVYRELYGRLDGHARQSRLCGSERGLWHCGNYGVYNIWKYYYYGQETYSPTFSDLDSIDDSFIDHPPNRPEHPKSVFVAPHANCQGNAVFTMDFWERLTQQLSLSGWRVHVNSPYGQPVYNSGRPFRNPCPDVITQSYDGYASLFQAIPRFDIVICGNTGVGWVAAACGVPLLAMEPKDSWMPDFRYRECGVKSLINVFSEPSTQDVELSVREWFHAQCSRDSKDEGLAAMSSMSVTLHDCYPQESWLEKFVPQSGQSAIDVGANIGGWTKFLASRFRYVHAIDPQAESDNAIRVQQLKNVVIHRNAAWSNIGRLMFRSHQTARGIQGAIAGVDDFIVSRGVVSEFEVDCRPVDLMGIDGRVDFIKMDVDGAEVMALIGCQWIIRKWKPALLIETHTDENRAWILCWLGRLKYNVELLGDNAIEDQEVWNQRTIYIVANHPDH